ncbi:MAG TPA: TonB-dependent receptor [Gemmatimonadales bacterium]|nr:TonB-dependent receptor [Gemmatimonadales bacterium]
MIQVIPDRRPWARIARRFLLALVMALAPATARAQDGSIAGRVTAAPSGEPLEGVRIAVTGSARAAVTNRRGEFRIVGLSAGSYVVTASLIGREPGRRTIVVPERGTATADFALAEGSLLLSDLVVTANRADEPASRVAATVHVLSGGAITTSPARTTDDLLRELPGVELPRTSSTVSGPEEIVSLRGADEGRTLVMLDGVPLNDPWGEWIQWNRAPRFQLDQVEVLEGGGSSLYGNYAMGGVISLASRPIVRRGYNLLASGGSRGAADASLYGSTVVGRLGLSLGGDYGRGGGYTLLRPDQRGPIDQASTVARGNVNARAEYALGGGNTLFASAGYFADDRSLGTPLTEPNQRTIWSGVVGATLQSVLGGTLQLRGFGQDQRYDSHASRVNADRTSETPLVAQRIPSHDLGGSVRWARPAGPFEMVAIGGDFRHMVGRMDETVYGATGGVQGTRTSGGTQEVGGAYVQAVLAPIQRLRIEASARFDAWRSHDGSRVDATTATPTTVAYEAKSNSAFAPRVGASFALLPTLTLRSSFYRAFRAPTLSEEYRTFFSGPNTFMGNPALTPEYLTGVDAGIDWRPVPAVEVRATAFLNHYQDLDDFTFVAPGATPGSSILQRQNVGEAKSRGIEGEIAIRPVREVRVAASYNYDRARITATDKPVNRVPLHRAAVRFTYDKRSLGALNVLLRMEGENHALGGARLAPFTVFDVDVRREIRPGLELFAAAENLFNREYIVNVSGPLESIGLPRTLRGGIMVESF